MATLLGLDIKFNGVHGLISPEPLATQLGIQIPEIELPSVNEWSQYPITKHKQWVCRMMTLMNHLR